MKYFRKLFLYHIKISIYIWVASICTKKVLTFSIVYFMWKSLLILFNYHFIVVLRWNNVVSYVFLIIFLCFLFYWVFYYFYSINCINLLLKATILLDNICYIYFPIYQITLCNCSFYIFCYKFQAVFIPPAILLLFKIVLAIQCVCVSIWS